MKLFKIIGLILVLSPVGQAFGVAQDTLERLHANDPSLTVLSLYDNQIGPAGAIALADVLRTNTSLTRLYLDGNQIGDAGAVALAEALRTNTSLTTLDLHANQIGPEGTVALAEALKVNTSLTTLDLRYSQIGPGRAHALAEALRTNTSLTELNLFGNRIGNAGAHALAGALRTNTSLTALWILDNQIGYAPRQEITELLRHDRIQERRALVPWSRPRHLQLASWNPQVASVVTTILLLEVRSRTQYLSVIDAQGRIIRLPYLPTEMWHKILGYLRCGAFGPLALPAP